VHHLIDPQRFSELVGRIYDCAVDPVRWPEVLEAFRIEVGFASAFMSLHSLPSGRYILNIITGVAPEWAERANGYPEDIVELWGGAESMWSLPFDRPSLRSRVTPSLVIENNRYFREWVQPQGMIDSLVIILAHDRNTIGNIAMGRHADQGPVTDEDLDRVALFIPHLQRAAKISQILEANQLASRAFETIIGELAVPVLLVDADMALTHSNAAAAAMLAEGKLLRMVRGHVSATLPASQRALADMVAQACREASSMRRGAVGLASSDDPDAVAAVYALPLSAGTVRRDIGGRGAVALFVASPQGPINRVSHVAAQLFDLTSAEGRVLSAVADGQSSQEIAAQLGIAPSTVKTHMLRLFDKTGTHRQADLVALSRSLSSPIG
jgi:DNA-binding CsgD family transcriptional regulator